jgi:haloalkane dehalogenase
VLTLIAHLEVNEFHLIVHDWGGAIGMGAAEYFPQRVGKIVITNTASFRSSIIPWQLRFCRIPLLAKVFIQGMNGFALPATRMAVVRRMKREVQDGYLFPYRSWSNRRATYKFVQDIPMKPHHESYETLTRLEENLKFLSDKKVGIFWGGKDFVFTKVFYEIWKKHFPNAQSHYFEEYGHYLLEDGRDAVIEQIDAFLTAVE